MLQLKAIKKDYKAGDTVVHALKGIDISFRKSEFVSILGPSGCGKTTLLNIIGGLDHYSDGELYIDGVSTTSYTDRDWDTYRNHRNVISKFKRTFLVCLADSIGRIGVATVLAVSTGTRNYIHAMQNDMLSGNPVTINAEALDMNAVMAGRSAAMQAETIKASIENGYVNVDNMIEYLVERSGNLSSFKVTNDITNEYLSYVQAMPIDYYAAIATYYGINLSNNLYTDFAFDGATKNTSLPAANQTYRAL